MFSRSLIFIVVTVAALAAACGEGPPARSEVLKNLVDDAIVPAYADLVSSTADLAAATVSLCDTRAPSDLASAHKALADARASWSHVEPWWVGPVMQRRSWVVVDWPVAVDEIEALVADTTIELDNDRLAFRIGADQRGLGAVEHILGKPGSDRDVGNDMNNDNGDDSNGRDDNYDRDVGNDTDSNDRNDSYNQDNINDRGVGNDTDNNDRNDSYNQDNINDRDVGNDTDNNHRNDSYNRDNINDRDVGHDTDSEGRDSGNDRDVLRALGDVRRCRYLTGIAMLIADEASLIHEDWTVDFEETGPYSDTFADADGEGLDDLVNDALFLIRAMADAELGTALGEMAREPDVEAIVEGPAGLAVADLKEHLRGLETTLVGNETTSGLAPLLGDDLTSRLRDNFEAVRQAVAKINPPLRAAVTEHPASVSAAREAISALKVTVATEVVSRLGVTIGFSDADGDTGS